MDSRKYDSLIAKAKSLVVDKAKDYQSSEVKLQDYFPFGDKSYVQMMHVKTLRLRSLVEKEDEPNFESVKDSVLDLINYSVFYLQHLEEVETANRRARK